MSNKTYRKVSLPYDFIPFPSKHNWQYEYNSNQLPKHNKISNLSGFLNLQVTPFSDLSMDFRALSEGKEYCVMGSALRGIVRRNIEILSNSFPVFIERNSHFMYRDFSGELKNDYFRKLFGESGDSRDVEKSIFVGYLEKHGNDFKVTPADPILNKNFKSIEEYRLLKSGVLDRSVLIQ